MEAKKKARNRSASFSIMANILKLSCLHQKKESIVRDGEMGRNTPLISKNVCPKLVFRFSFL
jgi:hypothetical protein